MTKENGTLSLWSSSTKPQLILTAKHQSDKPETQKQSSDKPTNSEKVPDQYAQDCQGHQNQGKSETTVTVPKDPMERHVCNVSSIGF